MNYTIVVCSGSEEMSESVANYHWSVLSRRLKKIRRGGIGELEEVNLKLSD